LSSGGDDRKPWISSDGQTLYFASNRDGSSDVFRSSREAPEKQFEKPFKLSNLSVSESEDGGPSLTADEKILAMASNRGSNGFQIYITTRANTMTEFGSLHQDHLSEVNVANFDAFDPFFTADGLRLYFAPAPAGTEHSKVMIATRPDVNSDFFQPIDVPGINVVDIYSASPALSSDELVIVFTSVRDGGAGELDVWYATRPDTARGFGTPVPIPVVNTAVDEADPMLSPDGCELFFSSRRNGGDHDLFVAQIAP
jgi:Tol biopolymer transport system component